MSKLRIARLSAAVGLRYLADGCEPGVEMASGGSKSLSSLAGPIRARPVIRSGGRRILIGLSMTDSKGNRVRGIHIAGGRRPPAPRAAIPNTAGTVVYNGKLAYG